MILSHDIPQGSKFYFGKRAKIKRNIEQAISEILYKHGYEEILVPTFSYLQHQRDIQNRQCIRISNPFNQQIILRHDITIDAMRLLSPHMEAKKIGKKWFYAQSILSYPTNEYYQLGVENLEMDELLPLVLLCVSILSKLGVSAILQLSNVKIPQICAQEFGIGLECFEKIDIDALERSHPIIWQLLQIQHLNDLIALQNKLPSSLRIEVERLIEIAQACSYKPIVLSPLFYAPMPYYSGLVFRFFLGNETLILGGNYEIASQGACGFGIYLDYLIMLLGKGECDAN